MLERGTPHLRWDNRVKELTTAARWKALQLAHPYSNLGGAEHEQLRDASFTDSARNLDTASEPKGVACERLERVDPDRIRSES